MNMDEALIELVKAIQAVAPSVWEIYMKQVIVNGIQDAIWILIMVVLGIICVPRIGRFLEELDDSTIPPLVWLIVALFGSIPLFLLLDLIGYFVNPEYYVIKLMLETIQ